MICLAKVPYTFLPEGRIYQGLDIFTGKIPTFKYNEDIPLEDKDACTSRNSCFLFYYSFLSWVYNFLRGEEDEKKADRRVLKNFSHQFRLTSV